MKSPIEVFSDWVDLGKDVGMEKNHFEPVLEMINLFRTKNEFTSIDAGCGNGWLVRYLSNYKKCKSIVGVDGSIKMIEKARSLDKNNQYFCSELSNWNPKSKVDVVFSMEVFYYFKKPEKLIKKIHDKWIKKNGKLIMGIDHYLENKECHGWKNKINISTMNLISKNEWIKYFKESGFSKVTDYQFCAKDNWKGTLVIEGTRV